MRCIFCIFAFFCALQTSSLAHDSGKHEAQPLLIPSAVERNFVVIAEEGDELIIRSNGIPDHATGDFPNRGNPNRISTQNHAYRVTTTPTKKNSSTPKGGIIGVALNGIPIEPATAECYGQSRGSRPSANCQWREEAIVNGRGQLGLDASNAHVQPNGTYHYHGIPNGLIKALKDTGKAEQDLVHVGYAADGFKIYVSQSGAYTSSYSLKAGQRAGGPGGRHTGQYTQDFAYSDGSGDLDRCNGAFVKDEYVYILTTSFPYAPRCLYGEAHSSFERKPGAGQGQMRNRPTNRPYGRDHRPPPRF